MGRGSGKGRDGNSSVFEGFAGTTNGSFFEAPAWVDKSQAPGLTSQKDQIKNNPNLGNILSGQFLFWSPNLVWLLVALLDYVFFPYDFQAAKVWALDWVAHRALVNIFIVFSYFGFWHVTLYWLNWGSRPFQHGRTYQWSKILHNTWYTFLGALQWTVWEAIFMHCYATQRLPYLSDSEASSSWLGAANFVAWCFIVPLYREFHFYFAHRLIHIKVLYKYVHSLHHRNTDIEPFAGLCMHPVEHMYYYSCIAPALYCFASPFAFMWNGVHLLISPAASHSGWEDNFQSDQFHYLHHRFFECNYGTGTFPFDYWFGTFRESLDFKKDKSYRGEHKASDTKAAAAADAKATLLGFPKWDEAVFNLICVGLFPALVACATLHVGPVWVHNLDARLLAFLLSAGPVVVGGVLLVLSSRYKDFKTTFLYPFHKEALFGAFGFNCLVGTLVSVLPVYHMIAMLLLPPGQGVYCQLHSSC